MRHTAEVILEIEIHRRKIKRECNSTEIGITFYDNPFSNYAVKICIQNVESVRVILCETFSTKYEATLIARKFPTRGPDSKIFGKRQKGSSRRIFSTRKTPDCLNFGRWYFSLLRRVIFWFFNCYFVIFFRKNNSLKVKC